MSQKDFLCTRRYHLQRYKGQAKEKKNVLDKGYILWFNFIPGSILIFLLFLCKIIYNNENKTKENEN